jgi:hypothetical protein
MASSDGSVNKLISCISFNMHETNQGINFLDSLCESSTDIILLQETWLDTNSLLNIVNCFCDNYHIFCSSAMDDRLSSGILKGRPFSGLCILLHKSFLMLFLLLYV